jgi:hypothetical protein
MTGPLATKISRRIIVKISLYFNYLFGGAEGDRTPDLRIANAALSQLSYGPFRIRLVFPVRF